MAKKKPDTRLISPFISAAAKTAHPGMLTARQCALTIFSM